MKIICYFFLGTLLFRSGGKRDKSKCFVKMICKRAAGGVLRGMSPFRSDVVNGYCLFLSLNRRPRKAQGEGVLESKCNINLKTLFKTSSKHLW